MHTYYITSWKPVNNIAENKTRFIHVATLGTLKTYISVMMLITHRAGRLDSA